MNSERVRRAAYTHRIVVVWTPTVSHIIIISHTKWLFVLQLLFVFNLFFSLHRLSSAYPLQLLLTFQWKRIGESIWYTRDFWFCLFDAIVWFSSENFDNQCLFNWPKKKDINISVTTEPNERKKQKCDQKVRTEKTERQYGQFSAQNQSINCAYIRASDASFDQFPFFSCLDCKFVQHRFGTK